MGGLWALFLSVPDIGSGAGGQGGCSCVCRFMFALVMRTKTRMKIPEWWAEKERFTLGPGYNGRPSIHWTDRVAGPPMLSVQRPCLLGERELNNTCVHACMCGLIYLKFDAWCWNKRNFWGFSVHDDLVHGVVETCWTKSYHGKTIWDKNMRCYWEHIGNLWNILGTWKRWGGGKQGSNLHIEFIIPMG